MWVCLFFQKKAREKDKVVAISTGLPGKVHVLSPLRILHMNRALSSVGRDCLSATFSRPIPIYFSDELPVQGVVALGFLHLVLGLLHSLFVPAFKNSF